MSASGYQDFYTPTFSKNYQRFGNIRKRVDKRIDKILSNPFEETEPLEYKEGKDLRGLRSTRIDRNFRIIFCIWEEYQKKASKALPLLPQAMQETLPHHCVIFLTVGPHEKAYQLR